MGPRVWPRALTPFRVERRTQLCSPKLFHRERQCRAADVAVGSDQLPSKRVLFLLVSFCSTIGSLHHLFFSLPRECVVEDRPTGWMRDWRRPIPTSLGDLETLANVSSAARPPLQPRDEGRERAQAPSPPRTHPGPSFGASALRPRAPSLVRPGRALPRSFARRSFPRSASTSFRRWCLVSSRHPRFRDASRARPSFFRPCPAPPLCFRAMDPAASLVRIAVVFGHHLRDGWMQRLSSLSHTLLGVIPSRSEPRGAERARAKGWRESGQGDCDGVLVRLPACRVSRLERSVFAGRFHHLRGLRWKLCFL